MNTPSQDNKKTLPGIFNAPATENTLRQELRNLRSDQRKANHEKGSVSEKKAAEYLKSNGYTILTQNFRFHKNEIDIIAKDGKYLVFVEVKARKNSLHGYGFQAVNLHKQSLIRKVAQAYLINNRLSLTDTSCRFDGYCSHPYYFILLKTLNLKIYFSKDPRRCCGQPLGFFKLTPISSV